MLVGEENQEHDLRLDYYFNGLLMTAKLNDRLFHAAASEDSRNIGGGTEEEANGIEWDKVRR